MVQAEARSIVSLLGQGQGKAQSRPLVFSSIFVQAITSRELT